MYEYEVIHEKENYMIEHIIYLIEVSFIRVRWNNFLTLMILCREILKKERKFNFFFLKGGGNKELFLLIEK